MDSKIETIVDLTFNQGGIRTHLPGISRIGMRKLAKELRPTESFGGTIPVKITDSGIYREVSTGKGILGSQITEWTLVVKNN